MNEYTVVISDDAQIDIRRILDYILNDCKPPSAKVRYESGLDDAIQKLSFYADAIGANEYIQNMFGNHALHIIFKKMAIVFYIEDDVVYIRHVIAMSRIH
jgi:plasmid stabilization system protein ParE